MSGLKKLKILVLVIMLLTSFAMGNDVFFNLTDVNRPLVVRQESGQSLIKLWEFEASELPFQFDISTDAGLIELSKSLVELETKASNGEAAPDIGSAGRHYLTAALIRMKILNDLDFSTENLRHFFSINSARYNCKETANVLELEVPDTFIDAVGTSDVLLEIKTRLVSEPFEKISYEITDRFGTPTTGKLGDVTPGGVGKNRFELYRKVYAKSRSTSLSQDSVGPYKFDSGYVFIKVNAISSGIADCFEFNRNRVAQDYGREWMKKIYHDTLTTAAVELKPQVFDFTTGTALSSPAYIVGGHTVSFQEARETLPFLFGNEKTQAFWKSIQRQALEVELIYHSQFGKEIRETAEYRQMIKVLASIRDAKQQLEADLPQKMTTSTLTRWFDDNRGRYDSITTVSYTLFKCSKPATSADDKARCAAELQILRDGDGKTSVSGNLASDSIGSVAWARQSREIQVACQDLKEGEWSEVFSEDGTPQVLKLESIKRTKPTFYDIEPQVRADFELDFRTKFWRDFAGISDN